MARTLIESPLTTRAARTKLPVGLHWRGVAEGVHLGYRKGHRSGRWLVRWRAGVGYVQAPLAAADDALDADGSDTLSFAQAQSAAVAHVEAARAAAKAAAEGPAPTVRSAIEAYIAERAKREHDRGDARSRLTRHVLRDELAERHLHALSAEDLQAWRDRLPSMADTSVRRTINDLRASLNAAAKRHRRTLSADIVLAIRDGLAAGRRFAPVVRERQVLPDADVRAVVAAAWAIDRDGGWEGDLGRLVLVLAATGARLSQVARMTVGDVQCAQRRLLVPRSRKGGDGKSASRIAVPVGVDVLEKLQPVITGRRGAEPLLERWRHVQTAPATWKRDRRGPWTSASEMTRPWRQIVERADLPIEVTAYAMRHSSIVRGLREGLPIRLVASLHDTSSAMIESHYSAYIVDALEALVARAIIPFGSASGQIDEPRRMVAAE